MRFVVSTIACLCLSLSSPALAQDAARQISVSGSGTAAAEPDMAVIRLGIEVRQATAQDTMAQVSKVTNGILDVLKDYEVDPRDMQTSELSLRPVYQRSGDVVQYDGFEASNVLSVRVRDLAKLGAVIGAALDSGANQLNGLSFLVDDPDTLLFEARTKAVEDARARAKTYALAAGVELGDVVEIREGGSTRPAFRADAMYEASPVAEFVPVAAGETTYSASVTVVYEIAD